MRRIWFINLFAAIIAVAAAFHDAPLSLLFGFDAPACDPGSFVFTPSLPTIIVKPVGTSSIRNAKRKGVKAALNQGLTSLGLKPKDFRNQVGDTVDDVFALDLDAVTMIDRTWTELPQFRPDKTVRILTVTWTVVRVTLLPANATPAIESHEAGHRLIEDMLKDLAATRFKAASAQIVDQVKTEAEILAILTPVANTLMQIGDEAQDSYDSSTKNGTDGSDQTQAATNAFNAAAANHP